MSTINSRSKGIRGELEFAQKCLTPSGIPARRGQQYAGSYESPDVKTAADPLFHFEVKRDRNRQLTVWYDQAQRDAGRRIAVVAHRNNRKPWMTTLGLRDFMGMLGERDSTSLEAFYRGKTPAVESRLRDYSDRIAVVVKRTGALRFDRYFEDARESAQPYQHPVLVHRRTKPTDLWLASLLWIDFQEILVQYLMEEANFTFRYEPYTPELQEVYESEWGHVEGSDYFPWLQ